MERPESVRFADLLREARRLITEERFLNWQAAFPGVWTNWQSVEPEGGFDNVIANPPWDRMKLQQVEWFATRRREIAQQQRAAGRKRMIAALVRDGDPLAQDYAMASRRAAMGAAMARRGGDYPLLSGGDVNLYSLFVERAMTLARPDGMVGLLTPSGSASDKTAARFFNLHSACRRVPRWCGLGRRRRRPWAPAVRLGLGRASTNRMTGAGPLRRQAQAPRQQRTRLHDPAPTGTDPSKGLPDEVIRRS